MAIVSMMNVSQCIDGNTTVCAPYLHNSLAGRGCVALCTSQMERAAMIQH